MPPVIHFFTKKPKAWGENDYLFLGIMEKEE